MRVIKDKTVIQNLTLDGKGKAGIAIYVDANHITIKNVTIKGYHGKDSCGIYIAGGCHDILIDSCNIYDIAIKGDPHEDNCANAILGMGDSKKAIKNVTVQRCKIHGIKSGYSEVVSFAGNVTNLTIRKNDVGSCSNIGIGVSGNYGYCKDKSKDHPRHVNINGNTVYACKCPYDACAGIYTDGGADVSISSNTVSKCQYGVEAGAEEKSAYGNHDITITGNVIKSCSKAGICIGGYEPDLPAVKKVAIKGNTISGCKTSYMLNKCSDIHIKGNHLSDNKRYIVYDLGKKYVSGLKRG